MIDTKELECPYNNKVKAAYCGTPYYCDFDGMEFESMIAHCSNCEMFENLLKKAGQLIKEDNDD